MIVVKTLQEAKGEDNVLQKASEKGMRDNKSSHPQVNLIHVNVNVSNRPAATRKGHLSYFSTPGHSPLLGWTVGDLLDFSASEFGDTPAFYSPFQQIHRTFRQLQQEVEHFAGGLSSLGLKKGDRIGVWSPNTYECYLAQLAGWKAGLIVVCINAALQSRELLYALNKVGVRCIVISKIFRSQDFYDILTKSVPEIKTSPIGELKSSAAPELEFVISVEPNLIGCINFYDVLSLGETKILLPPDQNELIQMDDVCTLCFTSGTTGSPKAVTLTHHNFVNNGFFVGRRLQLQTNDKICLAVPLFHVYGMQVGIFAALVHGATTIIPSYGYDPKAIAEVAAKERCTLITGTPTMFSDMTEFLSPGLDLSCVRACVTGGAICPLPLVQEIRRKLPLAKVVSNYGMTEIGCTFMGLPEDSEELASSTAGFPLENTEIKVVDKRGCTVEIGVEGELCVRSYAVTPGYWGEPDRNSESFEQTRWFHTGDLFILSESGHGKVVGRLKEMINRGGENVYPKEVEDFLQTHPLVKEAHVFGLPDVRMGEEPAAWLSLHEGASQLLTPADIRTFCRGQIAHFKIPKVVLFRSDFPRTPLGKVQKFRMREETLKILNKV